VLAINVARRSAAGASSERCSSHLWKEGVGMKISMVSEAVLGRLIDAGQSLALVRERTMGKPQPASIWPPAQASVPAPPTLTQTTPWFRNYTMICTLTDTPPRTTVEGYVGRSFGGSWHGGYGERRYRVALSAYCSPTDVR
jgi:hypothetical protein